MRRALEIVLLLGGALGLALGADALIRGVQTGWPPPALGGTGLAALLAGVALSLAGKPKEAVASRPATGLVGAILLGFEDNRPVVLSQDAGLAVSADPDGIVRLRRKDGRSAGRLICRSASRGAYFNSLRQDGREAAIKMAGPLAEPVRLELWDLTERA